MDPLDVAILALRLALVLLLYLFLAVVVRLAARGLDTAARPRLTPQAAGELQLLVEEPAASALPAGRVIVVQDGTTLGRAERAGLVVADPTVSGEHARVARQGTAWTIADLGSTNGTLLNQRPIHGQAPLAAGDVLALGNVRLRVVAT